MMEIYLFPFLNVVGLTKSQSEMLIRNLLIEKKYLTNQC